MRLSKTFIFFILILAFLFLGITAALFLTPRESGLAPPLLLVKPTPKPLASISFQPENLNLTSGQDFVVNVFLESQKEVVNADLEIIYDPQVLIFQQMSLGKFWPKGEFISQRVDDQTGQILVGLISFESASGSGNLVSLNFQVAPEAQNKTTELLFGEKTQVATSPKGEVLPLEVKKTALYTIIE